MTVDSGIFYEFIPADEFFNDKPARISLAGIELNKNYALILNTSAGLWGYSLGDTIKFISNKKLNYIIYENIKGSKYIIISIYLVL